MMLSANYKAWSVSLIFVAFFAQIVAPAFASSLSHDSRNTIIMVAGQLGNSAVSGVQQENCSLLHCDCSAHGCASVLLAQPVFHDAAVWSSSDESTALVPLVISNDISPPYRPPRSL